MFTMKRIFYSFFLLALLTSCNKQKSITELISLDSVWNHLEQFDKIAKENNSNRAVGTPGGIASKDYIMQTINKLGLNVVTQYFTNRHETQGCNLLVEIPGKSKEEVLLVGSHYDSVKFGPGINDNATGVAVVLDIIRAIQERKIIPERTLRFAFWDSEETGVEGSPYYYNSLNDEEKNQIATYLNIDMIASKDGEIYISDTDGSTIDFLINRYKEQGLDEEMLEVLTNGYNAIKFAEGSEKLEVLSKEVFAELGVKVNEDLQFALNSDTAPFLSDIPTMGISVVKIIEEEIEDGEFAILFAPCYHQSCDDITNVDKDILYSCLKATSMLIEKLMYKSK